MANIPDVVRSGIRAEDMPDLPDQLKAALDPLLRYVNSTGSALAQALSGISLSDNLRTEVKTVNLDHGVAQLVSLNKLAQAKGVRALSVGSADSKTQHMLAQPLHLIGTTSPGKVKVLAYFQDPTAVRVPVTLELTPEGSYTALTPKGKPDRASGGVGAQIGAATWASGAGFADVPNSSFTMTTNGTRAVLFHADVSTYNTAIGTWQIRLMQDGSQLSIAYTAAFNAVNTHQGWSFSWLILTPPAAGPHTYKLQFANSSAGGTLTTDANDYIAFTGVEI